MSNINMANISKTFGDINALKNVSLSLEKNKIYGLLGRNGAGKTTMLNIISNKIFPTSGDVEIDGIHLNRASTNLPNIYVADEKNLYPESMKVKDVFKWTKEFYADFDLSKAFELAREYYLLPDKKVKELSTGYNTILKDIIGLCVNTEFVFFDEPVLGLDANHRDMFYKHLLQSYLGNESTYVVSTHLIDEVANIIENVIIINQGEIIRDTTCEKLLSEGYTVSGTIENVDKFIAGKTIIGTDVLANTKAAYVLSEDDIKTTSSSIEISKMNLQKLFIELTKKEEEQ